MSRVILIVMAMCLMSCASEEMPEAPNFAPTLVTYQCPMHPHYHSEDENGTCPICGMGLVPMENDDTADTISVASDIVQTMGVRTGEVSLRKLNPALRAFGVVEASERLENVVVSRLEGWIEDLTTRAEGDAIRVGALLYRVYSPDLIAAQKDYLNALSIGNEKRIEATRQRLRSLGMQLASIDRVAETRKTLDRLPVYSEAGGIVASLTVREGDYLKPGTPVLRLQSYDRVWVMASVPESDLGRVDTGQSVTLSFPSAPQAPPAGRIDYIYPTIDPRTRTAQVRIEVDNAGGALRPGAYADVAIQLSGGERLAIPTEAILRDSRGAHVIVALGEGRFAGRPVQTGITDGVHTEVLSGLSEGERVVVSGQFMLDSEVNMREGLAKFGGEDAPRADPHAGH